MELEVIILAAGKGSRMRSSKPKVLHQIAGVPLIERVIQTAKGLSPANIHVICGYKAEEIKKACVHADINWVHQTEQLGTGDAVRQCLPHLSKEAKVIILSGDVPLLTGQTLEKLQTRGLENELVLLTASLDNPYGLGRVLRHDNGKIVAIREEKDATTLERQVKEIYSGIMMVSAKLLSKYLPELTNHNVQAEYYLTEIIEMAVRDKRAIDSIMTDRTEEIEGVNTFSQLECLERKAQASLLEALLCKGVCMSDRSRVDIRGDLECGQDVFIDINTIFEGKVILEDGVHIGPNCIIKDAVIRKNSKVFANSMIEHSDVGPLASVGPYARLRPGTILKEKAKVGNFVETKNTTLGENSKANHLSYVGDSLVGHDVNIGAGTITCNYDGVNKHKTHIGHRAFIGSGTQLVAPVSVGDGATIGAGTTLRRDAPEDKLTLSYAAIKTIESWVRPVKQDIMNAEKKEKQEE